MFLTSCSGDDVLLDQSYPVDVNGWKAKDTITLTVNITDTITPYDFYVNVRNSETYRNSNAFFFIKTIFPNGEQAVDTVECYLADLQGKWIGKGSGDYRDCRFRFQQNVRFPMLGNYRFVIQHGFREGDNKGLYNVGLRIIKHKKKNSDK